MTPDEMRRALGVLIDDLAEIAFGDAAPEFDAETAQQMLRKAGLTITRPATEEDAQNCPFGVTEAGDPFHVLTHFAVQCRVEAINARIGGGSRA